MGRTSTSGPRPSRLFGLRSLTFAVVVEVVVVVDVRSGELWRARLEGYPEVEVVVGERGFMVSALSLFSLFSCPVLSYPILPLPLLRRRSLYCALCARLPSPYTVSMSGSERLRSNLTRRKLRCRGEMCVRRRNLVYCMISLSALRYRDWD